MCSGPVSPDTISRAPRAIATISGIVVAGAGSAAPSDAAATDDGQRLLSRSPQHDRSQSVLAVDRGGQRPEPGRRPSLVRPRGAWIDEGVSVGTEAFGNRERDGTAWHRYRKAHGAIDHAERRQQAERLVNHVRRGARIGGRRVKQRRHRLAEMCARQANRPLAARQPRQNCRFEQALEIEHGVVPRGRSSESVDHAPPPPVRPRGSNGILRSRPSTRSSSSTYRGSTSQSMRACGKWRRSAAAAGMPWMMSPRDPRRMMRKRGGEFNAWNQYVRAARGSSDPSGRRQSRRGRRSP